MWKTTMDLWSLPKKCALLKLISVCFGYVLNCLFFHQRTAVWLWGTFGRCSGLWTYFRLKSVVSYLKKSEQFIFIGKIKNIYFFFVNSSIERKIRHGKLRLKSLGIFKFWHGRKFKLQIKVYLTLNVTWKYSWIKTIE